MFLDFTFRVRQAGVYSKEWNMYIFVDTIFKINKLPIGGRFEVLGIDTTLVLHNFVDQNRHGSFV